MQETTTKYEALEELASYPQWVAWEYNRDKSKKTPISSHTWGPADTTNPETWSSYDEALLCAGSSKQVGFVFTEHDPFTGIDLDDCIVDGEVLPWALEIVGKLNSYTEVSPSGKGLKIWVRASKPGDRCRTGSVELYDEGRFFTFTGKQFGPQSRIQDRQEQLERLYQELFPQDEHAGKDLHGGVEVGGVFGGNDAELLDKARKANGTGEQFTKLYDRGDWHGYKSQSEADLALCGSLAFWTGKDAERMDKLFRSSKLCNRKKWDSRRGSSTWGEQTIAKAIKGCKNTYDPNFKADSKPIHKLAGCFELVVSGKWSGRSGPTDRDVYKALIDTCGLYGRVTKDGVEVSASLRDLALRSGIGRLNTVMDALTRLQEHGLIRKVENGTKKKAATYLVLTQNRYINNRVNNYVSLSSQKIRNPSLNYGTIGKRNGHIIDYVRALGRTVSLEELAKHFGVRKNNLKTRYVNLIVELELLEEVDGGYVTPIDIEERLQRELKESGQLEAEKLQEEKYERERQAWRQSGKATTTVLISKQASEVEEIVYYNPEDFCIHGLLHGIGCYLHDENHPYRLKERMTA
jgi:hypothetical protein